MNLNDIKKFFFRKPKIELEGNENTVSGNVPEKLVQKCDKCKAIILSNDLENNQYVCPKCGFHFKIGARERLNTLVDEGSFVELFTDIISTKGKDFPNYDDKLEKAMEASFEKEGVICGTGDINGSKVAVFAMEYRFMMGSMGEAVGEKITRTFEYATSHGLHVVGFILSGGARMQEGIISLMQMAKTSGAVGRHSQAGLLYAAVLTNPTTGGVSASFAFQADIIIAEPNSLIGFAGPRVIEQTIRQKLPPSFQTAEFLLDKGFIDIIVTRNAMKEKLSEIIKLHSKQ